MTRVFEWTKTECDKCGAIAFRSSLGSDINWKRVERYGLDFCPECLEKSGIKELIDEYMTGDELL